MGAVPVTPVGSVSRVLGRGARPRGRDILNLPGLGFNQTNGRTLSGTASPTRYPHRTPWHRSHVRGDGQSEALFSFSTSTISIAIDPILEIMGRLKSARPVLLSEEVAKAILVGLHTVSRKAASTSTHRPSI